MKITVKVLIVGVLCLAFTTPAEAQIFKKGKKINAKEQLIIERRRIDSLTSILEGYQLREQELSKTIEELQQEEVYRPEPLLSVEYTPAQADSLAEQLKLEQVENAMQNFFDDYICEPETLSTDSSMDSLYTARLNALVSPIHLPYNELVRSYIKRYTDSSGLMSRVLSLAQYYFPMIEEELIKAELPVE